MSERSQDSCTLSRADAGAEEEVSMSGAERVPFESYRITFGFDTVVGNQAFCQQYLGNWVTMHDAHLGAIED
jgi:hypothetical protein